MTTAKTQTYEQVCSSTMFLILTILLIWLVGANHTIAEAGSMLISDTDPSLALNAYGGAQDGTILKLVKNCPPNNSDCTWTYRNGMLISDTDPRLAVNAYGGARDGTILKLVKNCPPNNSDCTWTYRNGMLISDTDPSLAVNAYGGAKDGTVLKLVKNCPQNNPDCTWKFLGNLHTVSGIDVEFEQPVSSEPPPKPSRTTTKISSDGSVIGISQAPLAGVPDKMWDPGQTLRVRMTGGTATVRSKVRQFAEEWTKYANIRFQFVDDSSPAEIKISFDQGKGSWSTIGRDALSVPFNYSTMNFDNLSDSSSNRSYGKVLHEFGHALGLIHEHQSPAAGIPWNKEKVYRYFKESQNPPWDRAKVDQNIFDRYSASSTNYSQYDPTSIMHYAYSADLLLNGQGVAANSSLSRTDKQYIAKWYPFSNADSGQLRTNDDCDQIDFQVEYGIEDKDKVHFLLRPGSTVTWWKSIEVPVAGNKYEELEIHDNVSSDRMIDKASLDSSRPIRFNKAKMWGIHTLLGYRWDVISALPGGSRVTLDWLNDRCR